MFRCSCHRLRKSTDRLMLKKRERRLLYEFIYDHIVANGVEVLRSEYFWKQTVDVSLFSQLKIEKILKIFIQTCVSQQQKRRWIANGLRVRSHHTLQSKWKNLVKKYDDGENVFNQLKLCVCLFQARTIIEAIQVYSSATKRRRRSVES